MNELLEFLKDREARVFVVQPGDVLVLSNLDTVIDSQLMECLSELKEQTGVAHIFAFEAEIDLAVLRRNRIQYATGGTIPARKFKDDEIPAILSPGCYLPRAPREDQACDAED